MVKAGVVLVADIPAIRDNKIRTQQGADHRIFLFGVAPLVEIGQPGLLYVIERGVIRMEAKAVPERCNHQIFVRRSIAENAGFYGYPQRQQAGIQIFQQAQIFSTSCSNVRFIASIQGAREAVRAGFKNGFAGWPLFPYSSTLAIMALLRPSERGSAKPTFTL